LIQNLQIGEVGLPTTICRTGIPNRIRISQRRQPH